MPRGRVAVDPHIRFWAKVEITPDCWNWTGAKNEKGYGMFKPHRAHRVSYQWLFGELAPGVLLDHTCHNKACVRPDHLRPVTNKQNTENVVGAQRNSKSGVRGVWWDKDASKWRAAVRHNRKLIHVGYFESIEDADAAVKAKRNELFTHNDMDRKSTMNTINAPRDGDIGQPLKWVEIEPVEVPARVPEPEKVPA